VDEGKRWESEGGWRTRVVGAVEDIEQTVGADLFSKRRRGIGERRGEAGSKDGGRLCGWASDQCRHECDHKRRK
jgi:hypothetical protein